MGHFAQDIPAKLPNKPYFVIMICPKEDILVFLLIKWDFYIRQFDN